MINIQNLSEKSGKLFKLLSDSGLSEEKALDEMVKLEDIFYRTIIEDILGDVTGEKLNALDKMYDEEATDDQIAAFLNITPEELSRRFEQKMDEYIADLSADQASLKEKVTENVPTPTTPVQPPAAQPQI